MYQFTDGMGRPIRLSGFPQRIVSLVPSLTETLWGLGLEEEVVGITKFCIHPEPWFRSKTRIGGTKDIHLEKLKSLQPGLVLASKEENIQEQIDAIATFCPVWVTDVKTIADALQTITSLGEITNKTEEARKLRDEIGTSLKFESSNLKLPTSNSKPTAAYLIWKNPYMTVGGDTFIHHMMTEAGFENAFDYTTRYPVVTVENIRASKCRFVFLSSEPYPFNQKNVDELQAQLSGARVVLVDGELFSWYGSRMIYAGAYFRDLKRQLAAG